MEAWLALGRGPLFRFCFALLILGLFRILFLAVADAIEARRLNVRTTQDVVNGGRSGLLARLRGMSPLRATTVLFFHAGLIMVPLFAAGHVFEWKARVGFAWPSLPQQVANALTLMVLVTCVLIFLRRVIIRRVRQSSRWTDFIWPLFIPIPFAAGYLCANVAIQPALYQWLMLIHLLAGNLMMVMIPFTGISRHILPVDRYGGLPWKLIVVPAVPPLPASQPLPELVEEQQS